MDVLFDNKELTELLYDGEKEYAKFQKIRQMKETNETFKFRPETYCYEPNEHLAEEGKVLLELMKLHRSKAFNVSEHLPYIADLTHYSRSVEVHFNLFRNICQAFASPKNAEGLKKLVDEMSIVGSVLLQEFNFDTNVVNDQVEVK